MIGCKGSVKVQCVLLWLPLTHRRRCGAGWCLAGVAVATLTHRRRCVVEGWCSACVAMATPNPQTSLCRRAGGRRVLRWVPLTHRRRCVAGLVFGVVALLLVTCIPFGIYVGTLAKKYNDALANAAGKSSEVRGASGAHVPTFPASLLPLLLM